jgi:negative regulator of flagellin synthesis FlgM
MQIYPKNLGPLRPDTARNTSSVDQADQSPIQPIAPTPSSADRSDKVQISDAGRALAARADGSADAASSSSSLDPARASRIRQRVLSGAYDTLEVVDAVSRRILDSGDL